MANCLEQLSPTTCNKCASPFQNVDGKCEMPIPKCSDYGAFDGPTPGLCQTCLPGYTLWLGQCIKLSCTQTNSNGLCTSCPAGFYYYLGVCLAIPIENCRTYDNAVCQLCNYGYFVDSSGKCSLIKDGCLTTNPDTGRCL
jgi:hypothetical protein